MKSIIIRLWTWILSWFRRPNKPFQTVWLEELPDALDSKVIYVAGENNFLWFAALVCPCGCGETLYMNLQPDSRPCWRVNAHTDGTVTLHPSVWRQVGCRSHFFVRRGMIEWCCT
jgi:hypothetical protein